MQTDPAATARVPETTAQRVLEKNALTVMVFPAMDSHVRSEIVVLHTGVEIAQPMVIVPHDQTVPTAQAMPIVHNEVNVLLTVIVHNAAIVLVMVIVMVPLVVTDHHARQVTAPHTGTEATVMPVQNVVDSAGEALVEHLAVSVQVETVEDVRHTETETVVRNVQIVFLMAIALSEVIVLLLVTVAHVQNEENAHALAIAHNAVNVRPTVIVDHDQSAQSVLHMVIVRSEMTVHNAEIVLPTVIVKNVHALAIAVVVLIVLVLHVLEVAKSVLAGKNQNLLKSSVWRANCAWFALTTMIPGSMTMLLVMNSTRSPVMN